MREFDLFKRISLARDFSTARKNVRVYVCLCLGLCKRVRAFVCVCVRVRARVCVLT